MIDAYLKLTAATGVVAGESTDATCTNWIELTEFDLGSGTRGAAKAAEKAVGPLDERLTKLTDTLKKLSAADTLASAKQSPRGVDEMATLAENALTNAEEIRTRLADFRKELQKAADDATAPTGDAGGPTVSDEELDRLEFSVHKDLDAASADLFQMYCRLKAGSLDNKHADYELGKFEEAVVVLRKLFAGTPTPYLTCTFNRVALKDYKLKFDDDKMTESLKFTFVDFNVVYEAQSSQGTASGLITEVEGTLGGKGGKA